LFEVLDECSDVQERPQAHSLSRFRQQVQFHDVSFRYREEWVLRHVNLSIATGQVVALVGPSGGGKSTLADLIPRFYDVSEGQITVDGTDLRALTLASLRAQIAVVTQATFLFNDSVRNNIAYGLPHRPEEEIIAAARAAHAHDFIMALPDEYETVIGERGSALSGGQRQRLAIARALLKRSALLILDEATSHLDTENERTVREAIAELMAGSTTIVIAHRLSTVRDADRIVVLEKGRVAGIGTHTELLRQGGPYAQLIRAQLQVPPTPVETSEAPVPQPA
jgi:subfamily B ATP-binding cassette protein MsbA